MKRRMNKTYMIVYSGPHYGRAHVLLDSNLILRRRLVLFEPTGEQYWVPVCDCEVPPMP